MNRREAQLAKEENRTVKKLLESDYLLGVFDEHRMGGVRFRVGSEGPFLDNNHAQASPPWATLRELEHASLELEKEDSIKDPNYSKWLKMLIQPGSSLGGARPKASVVDEKKHLWIAKFPSNNDEHDIGAWEMLLHQLATKSQINTAQVELKKFNSPHHIFLSKRFDRNNKKERIHFSSAMTMLQRKDGEDGSFGVSYLELAKFIIQNGAQPSKDLEQLWRRIVFFICVSNVDDHLRNHGFILQDNGWILAPAYDMNPVANSDGLTLNISENDNSQDLSLALDVASFFRIKPKQAKEIIQDILDSVKNWREEAKLLGISKNEQEMMSSAFKVFD